MEIAGLYIASYLLGSLPTAYLIGKLVRGVDIRNYGSGNVGGSNVLHHFGKRWSVPAGVVRYPGQGSAAGLDRPVRFGVGAVFGIAGGGAPAGRSGPQLVDIPEVSRGAGHSITGRLFTGAVALDVGCVCRSFFLTGWALTRSSGVWVLISMTLLPVWAVLVRDPVMISYYCVGLLALVIAKRLLSNWTPFPEDLPKGKVLFNRLFLDRDVEERAEWVHRVPQGTE